MQIKSKSSLELLDSYAWHPTGISGFSRAKKRFVPLIRNFFVSYLPHCATHLTLQFGWVHPQPEVVRLTESVALIIFIIRDLISSRLFINA